MTVRWTVRSATDRGPQAESRVLFGAPKKKYSRNSVGAFSFTLKCVLNLCHRVLTDALRLLTGSRVCARSARCCRPVEQEETQSNTSAMRLIVVF